LLQAQARQARPGALTALASAARARPERASTDSTSYRIARAWRLAVHARVIDGLIAPARGRLDKDFELPGLPQQEGVVWPIVTQRPRHLLSPRFKDWTALFEDAAQEVRTELQKQGPLAQRSWGEQNTARICHPLARAMPGLLKTTLCMPFEPLAGDAAMPRVQHPDFGASERMVVAPGHEADGIIHMPGGQSGHPMSPYWGAGHEDWVQGQPTPFLPGKPQYVLRMRPE
jgi:penicillin amidase